MEILRFNEAAAHHRGEPLRGEVVLFGYGTASMRPRLITAENRWARRCCSRGPGPASMRPRLITAENPRRSPRTRPSCGCRFNEAAAHHRGEPAAGGVAPGEGADASMRPRLITAENPAQAARPVAPPMSFNEAAAHHRGEPLARTPPVRQELCRFNEAAAHHRGEPRAP